MQSKQTLRVFDKDLEDIVKIQPSITSYIDGEYYKVVMEEQDKNIDKKKTGMFSQYFYAKNFPVKVEAMRCNWILSSDGKRFFQ